MNLLCRYTALPCNLQHGGRMQWAAGGGQSAQSEYVDTIPGVWAG